MRRLLAAILIGGGAIGCSAGETFDPTKATAISLDQSAATLGAVGETLQLHATVRNGQGAPLAGVLVSWTSANPGVATVDNAGLVTAVANGATEITAQGAGLTAKAAITVSQVPASIALTVDTVRFASLGDTLSLVVTLKDARDNPVSPAAVHWSSSNPAVATVSAAGQITTVKNGEATILAQAAAAEARAAVIVAQVVTAIPVTPGTDTLESISDTVQLQAVAVDARGNRVPGVRLLWASDAPTVATVDSAGRVASHGDGIAAITATGQAPGVVAPAKGQATVRVRQKPIRLVWELTPAPLEGSGMTGIGVRVEDARGHLVAGAADPVAISLTQGSAAGVLTGPQAIVPTAGRADLGTTAISLPGLNYRLTAKFPGLADAVTPLLTVYHRFASLTSGGGYVCARDLSNATWCWGDNQAQQYLIPGITQASVPVRAPALDQYQTLLTGGAAVCGAAGGQLFCWANITFPIQPTPIVFPGAAGITAFHQYGIENFGCGLAAGKPVCWGEFSPTGLPPSLAVQPLSAPLGVSFAAIGVGNNHLCGLTAAGTAYCYGNNEQGQLGDGTIFGRLSFAPVGGGLQFSSIDGGLNHTCGVTRAGALYCWGDNRIGQLGDMNLGPRSTLPVLVSTPVPLTSVSLGFEHGCGVGTDHNAYCWGRGWNGEIGNGAAEANNHAVQRVPLPDPVQTVSVGAFHSCALTVRGQAFCWGLNSSGQRGDGAMSDWFTPTPVSVSP